MCDVNIKIENKNNYRKFKIKIKRNDVPQIEWKDQHCTKTICNGPPPIVQATCNIVCSVMYILVSIN